MAQKKKIGILTGGGDCPGLNAVIRAVTRHAVITHGWEVIGIEDGFQGLFEQRYRPITLDDVRGLLSRGGTILGSSNRSNPLRYPVKQPDGSEVIRDVTGELLVNLEALGLEALIAIGGDGTLLGAQHLIDQGGARIVGVPKTIDNDLSATDLTFGHMTACEIATDALDRLHTTAESHDRVMLCEVMGRYAGWIAMVSGLAGGADAILIPEIPYQIDRVAEAIRARSRAGITFAVICVAEGAKPEGGEHSVLGKARVGQDRLGGAAERLAGELHAANIGHEIRATVLGHVQRGGPPSAFDRLLATRYGVGAVDLVARGELSRMVALRGERIESVPIALACGKLKTVEPDGELVRVARATGVELGA